ncbi:phage tail sheath family protein [Dolichospermum flos-aquae]|uniref:Phage tail sheath family protein n=1 Tax=Dolichospermum flos-aquae LEGE 04289 TaxID=1828708 RepID=A0ACC5PWU9_DOLFA|nr:phage tail sheath subtilisin-like domain-containing protein [Dolichospermum flos-aquae]MBE9217546.1 phage tail sheath family protein [Dolichospermum flos-aquae LEGE 04289]
MPTYLSPGVYVEEVSSGSAPIAGAGTSVAGFIGIFERKSPAEYYINKISQEKVGVGDGKKKIFSLKNYPVATDKESVTLPESIKNSEFKLNNVTNDKISNIEFTSAPPDKSEIIIDYWTSVSSGEIKLITNFTEFKQFFGDFTKDNPEQNIFAHAVYGFFRNGGTRAYVTWVSDTKNVDGVLNDFEAIDEISIVVAPGQTDNKIIGQIKDHAANMGDRIAILDCKPATDLGSEKQPTVPGFTSHYAAFYFPWIQVYDPATKTNIFVPPSGHIAGVYARVDGERGVHKAPANVPLLGALDLQFNISKAKQDRLNPQGVNVIRKLNGNILVWGARTLGGDANLEFKYINVRRHFCYLKDSIDKGTQWVVFEPNTPELWAKIRRNISAFLTLEWRKGALFGTTPQEAFYVQCDGENNKAENEGKVVIEIGVAVVKPAEFVIFRLSQWSGAKE